MGEITTVKRGAEAAFRNRTKFCVGTGRLGLGLQKEYYDQLKMVQEEIGFSYIRGHGIFHDDLAIYHEYEKDGQICVEYNFTYLDRLFDSYLQLHIRPFIELGFMPKKLASGEQTIFYWKGCTTPPKSEERWTGLIQALLRHLMERYGREEVITWPIEVWNEPNLPGFWYRADMEAYCRLYDISARAVKAVDSAFTVGGPAICGVDDVRWLRSFLEFVQKEKSPIDFVTRHAYAVDEPDVAGHYAYQKLRDPEVFLQELQVSREIIDSFPEFRDMPMHITEFNTSYVPNCPLHDTNRNAAYISRLLANMGDTCASYSYWTFGDVFEEMGVPYTPFHGGFGLVANGLIPKPTYWAFSFFSRLCEKGLYRDETMVVTEGKKGYCGVAFDCENRTLVIETDAAEGSRYVLITRSVDEEHCNPLKAWHDLGEPANPSEWERKVIRDSAVPYQQTTVCTVTNGTLTVTIPVGTNGVTGFELIPATLTPDRGYDYERVAGQDQTGVAE